ncbi:hypothetical protein DL240_05565 [Lujinxingia litoralis]|uniref:Uncharacterized protein n=1 Tax=Lujinxingia litoralis TaxID=2211119 RepID=A0A328C9L2_9DELT|nr:hypothetical protein [Lujinxingia litoralis]RAL23628.1 hypothetical protein DL240_05565 [Lujinxingia litoralis]
MSIPRNDYDATEERIRVYPTFDTPRTLVPKDEIKAWSNVVQTGKDEQGRPVKAVRFVFENEESALYNQQALSFARLETYVDDGAGERPAGNDEPQFSVREDFGIDK